MCPVRVSLPHQLGAELLADAVLFVAKEDKITESSHNGHIGFVLLNLDESEINILDQNRSWVRNISLLVLALT